MDAVFVVPVDDFERAARAVAKRSYCEHSAFSDDFLHVAVRGSPVFLDVFRYFLH